MNRELKSKIVLQYGSQAAAVQELRSDIPGLTERRLSRLIHGFDSPKQIEADIFRERLGVSFDEPGREEERAG